MYPKSTQSSITAWSPTLFTPTFQSYIPAIHVTFHKAGHKIVTFKLNCWIVNIIIFIWGIYVWDQKIRSCQLYQLYVFLTLSNLCKGTNLSLTLFQLQLPAWAICKLSQLESFNVMRKFFIVSEEIFVLFRAVRDSEKTFS